MIVLAAGIHAFFFFLISKEGPPKNDARPLASLHSRCRKTVRHTAAAIMAIMLDILADIFLSCFNNHGVFRKLIAGQSCDAVCTGAGKTCEVEKMRLITSETQMTWASWWH